MKSIWSSQEWFNAADVIKLPFWNIEKVFMGKNILKESRMHPGVRIVMALIISRGRMILSLLLTD
jgi:hypothetical protein